MEPSELLEQQEEDAERKRDAAKEFEIMREKINAYGETLRPAHRKALALICNEPKLTNSTIAVKVSLHSAKGISQATVAKLRAAFYPRLADVANRWASDVGETVWPELIGKFPQGTAVEFVIIPGIGLWDESPRQQAVFKGIRFCSRFASFSAGTSTRTAIGAGGSKLGFGALRGASASFSWQEGGDAVSKLDHKILVFCQKTGIRPNSIYTNSKSMV